MLYVCFLSLYVGHSISNDKSLVYWKWKMLHTPLVVICWSNILAVWCYVATFLVLWQHWLPCNQRHPSLLLLLIIVPVPVQSFYRNLIQSYRNLTVTGHRAPGTVSVRFMFEFTVTYRTATVNVITVHTVRYDVFWAPPPPPRAFTRYDIYV